MSGVFERLADLASPWGYVAVGILALLESSAFVGLVAPGELGVLFGGYLASQGRAGLGLMIAVAGTGATVGDSIGYQVGRLFGVRLRESRLGARVGEDRWAGAERYLSEKGGRAVFLGRFVGVLRALVPALAGASRMPYGKFLAWDVLGAGLWSTGLVLLGYVAGSSYRRVAHYAGRAGLLLLLVVVVVGAVVALARWAADHPEEVRAAVGRQLDRPAVGRFRARYRSQVDFLAGRLRPGSALGLSLTGQLLLLALAGWAFGSILQDVLAREELVRLDTPIWSFVVDHRVEWLTSAMRGVTLLGSAAVLVPVTLAAGLAARLRSRSWTPLAVLVAAFVGAVVLADVVKALVGRPRPGAAELVPSGGFSFPSGHAAQATAVFCALAYLVAAAVESWPRKVAAWTVAAVVVMLVGFSRLYLGVHWPSDVLGGFALGGLWLAALVATTSTLRHLWTAPTEAIAPGSDHPVEAGPA